MFDFILGHPYILILLVYALTRLFGNKAKKAREEQQKQVQATATAKKTSFQDRLEEAMRQAGVSIDQATMTTGRPSTPALTSTLPPPVETLPTRAADDPYAFHSAGTRVSEKIPERIDYDLNQKAFEFRSATKEPVEQEYHLTGFTGFHQAQGLSHLSSLSSLSGTLSSMSEPIEQQSAALNFFAKPEDLRRAIILNEIFGKPKSLRGRGF